MDLVFLVNQAKHNILPVKRCATTAQLEDLNPISKPLNPSALNVGGDVGKMKLLNQYVNGVHPEDMAT